jgi:hypothetical protein
VLQVLYRVDVTPDGAEGGACRAEVRYELQFLRWVLLKRALTEQVDTRARCVPTSEQLHAAPQHPPFLPASCSQHS